MSSKKCPFVLKINHVFQKNINETYKNYFVFKLIVCDYSTMLTT